MSHGWLECQSLQTTSNSEHTVAFNQMYPDTTDQWTIKPPSSGHTLLASALGSGPFTLDAIASPILPGLAALPSLGSTPLNCKQLHVVSCGCTINKSPCVTDTPSITVCSYCTSLKDPVGIPSGTPRLSSKGALSTQPFSSSICVSACLAYDMHDVHRHLKCCMSDPAATKED